MTTGDKQPPDQRNRRVIWFCLTLALLTLAVFGRTLGNDFFNLDDPFYITENSTVTNGLTLHGISHAFTHGSPANWDPLTTISHMADWQLYGPRPFGHHLTNLLLHTVTVVFLFVLLRQMTGAIWPSAFAAALFAIHPLRVESVAWVTERKDVLSGFFFVLTLGAYTRYVRRQGKWPYLLLLIFFSLGLLSKAMLVTLPLVLLLLDYWPLNRRTTPFKFLLIEKIPLLALSLLSAVVGFVAQGGAVQSLESVPLQYRLGNAALSCSIYLRQLFWPANLAPYYPFPHQLPAFGIVLSLGLLAALTLFSFLRKSTRPYLLVGWLWYLIMLSPVIGLLQLGGQSHADRYTYLPQIGLAIALSWWLASWNSVWVRHRLALATTAAAIIAALSAATIVQSGYWHDSITLWQRTLACTSSNSLAEYNYGMALIKEKRLPEGRAHLEQAIQIRPNYLDAINNLGSVCFEIGDFDQAVLHYQQALALQPGDAMARQNLLAAQSQLARQAWSLATHPDASHRDGPRSLNLARQLVQSDGGHNPGSLLILAAACAETGQFPQANALIDQARQLATAPNPTVKKLLDDCAKAFQSAQPYRDNTLNR